ncbi:MAG: DegT/DnrJ/EryC1/StrS family aminotransferase [Thermoguttaceae bacterium]
MWSRKRLDIGWRDLAAGMIRAFFPPDIEEAEQAVRAAWPEPEKMFPCLSVRSGFDLLLSTLDLPRGSEVLVSAITIPDMVRILETHGLVPVPIDLTPWQMAADIERWRSALTPTTRAILVAHLFGGRIDIEPILAFARQHALRVFEDCAQGFAGTSYPGHPEADASMFSFGVIKTSTALGGAVLRIRDAKVLEGMRCRQSGWPTESRWRYPRRLAKYGAFKLLTGRPAWGLLTTLCRRMGGDYDRWINGAARGFPGNDLLRQIRKQPCGPLLAVLAWRLRDYDVCRWANQAEMGRSLARTLAAAGIACPGAGMCPHVYWVFAVTVSHPQGLVAELAAAGFDATQGQSLCVVQTPPDRPGLKAVAAGELLSQLVFLPFYPEMPRAECQRMADVVVRWAQCEPSKAVR